MLHLMDCYGQDGLGKVFLEILMNESSLFHLSVRLRRKIRGKVKKKRIKLKNKLNNKKTDDN